MSLPTHLPVPLMRLIVALWMTMPHMAAHFGLEKRMSLLSSWREITLQINYFM